MCKIKNIPNWCINELVVEGGKKDLDKVVKNYTMMEDGDEKTITIDFNKVAPCPIELHGVPSPNNSNSKERFIKNYGSPDWYDWQCKNWGCKWNGTGLGFNVGKNKLEFQIETPWSPPYGVVDKLSIIFPKLKFTLMYCEPGMGFCGQAIFKSGELLSNYDSNDSNDPIFKYFGMDWDNQE